MRRNFSYIFFFLASSLWLLSSCGGQSSEIVIQIQKDDPTDNYDDVNALRVMVRDLEEEKPEIYGPFALDREQQTRLSTSVPPGHDFYVDVWACPTIDSCAPIDVLARGCSDVIASGATGGENILTVTLYRAGTNDATNCVNEI
jgi:hypothetical protein